MALEPANPELLFRAIELYHQVGKMPPATAAEGADATTITATNSVGGAVDFLAAPSPMAARVLAEESEGLLGPGGVSGAVAALVALAEDPEKGSLGARVCAARAIVLVGDGAGSEDDQKKCREQAVKVVRDGLQGRGVTVQACVDALEVMKGVVAEAPGNGEVRKLREACAEVFPMAEAFGADAGVGSS